ncbi:MAG: cbb3-type cytochrome oxidase assembly protein CcoS [Arenicellales bacterium]
MDILFLLIPLAVLIAFIIAAVFFWSVKSGQFDDMQGPAHTILMDDDAPSPDKTAHKITTAEDSKQARLNDD